MKGSFGNLTHPTSPTTTTTSLSMPITPLMASPADLTDIGGDDIDETPTCSAGLLSPDEAGSMADNYWVVERVRVEEFTGCGYI